MPTVTFLPHERSAEVEQGTTLIRAALDAGVHINASCGGNGVCGKCRVRLEQGEVSGGISEKLSQEDVDQGYRLACLAEVQSDLTVRVPVESEVDASVLMATPRKTAHIKQLDLEDFKEKGVFIPAVEQLNVQLTPPSSQDNAPDMTRLINHLKLKHDEHRLVVDLPAIRKIVNVLREQDFNVTVTMARPVREGSKTAIINVHPGDTADQNYSIAMDIGTTTVYGQLLDLNTGQVLAENGDFNAQMSYGEDVINRIVHAEKGNGLEELNKAVLKTINSINDKLVKKAGIDPDCISTITIAGNTTMTQLLLKINPRYIRRSPYVPACTLFPPFKASELGIELGPHVQALVYPAVSSYVGGDIVAGVMGSLMYREEEITLYIDVGTNAEIVIGNKDWMACAACSAGPAFEGGGMKFGMRADKGAIEDFSLDPVTLEPMVLTVGQKKPRGICGSGLITAIAVMFEMGVIDNRGKFNPEVDSTRIRENDGIMEYVLAWAEETDIGRDVTLQEPDVDNLIRAKGAIYSGCMTLLNEIGLSINDLDRIMIAGGFGSYIDLEKAMTIGLLPEMDADKITFVGNGSMMGAKMSSLNNHIRRDVVEVTTKMTNFELSETTSYMDNYMASLFLPHTELENFPRLNERLRKRRELAKGGD
ncbi:ASKHA domain-containing protein [Desulfovermiculus halophilus]|uniref:ASKHA domain-containing protein n=1 Tax=Desulfovermiculus halophilus TaxID=339722 RepID=UPI00055828E1|nr:ASKHA domain-containing protein [Desulfovermiculus halophilus]